MGSAEAMSFKKLMTVALALSVSCIAALAGGWYMHEQAVGQEPQRVLDQPAQQGGNETTGPIAWGQAVDGLQAGIGFRPGEGRPWTIGQSANFVIYLRNVGDKPLSLSYIETLFEEFLLAVEDETGARQTVVHGPRNLGLVASIQRTLEPRQTIRVGHAWLTLERPGRKGVATGPTLVAPAGTYRVFHSGFPVRRDGKRMDESQWPTGKHTIRILN
jgi:hypothetical protein